MAANTTPSKTPLWLANNTGRVNKYGAPPNNGNRQPLNEANSISTQDYTGRGNATTGENATNTADANAAADLASPLTLTANAQTIVIPPNAVSITMVSTATFSFAEPGSTNAAGGALGQYVAWPANTPVTLQTARISQLLVTGTTPLSFFFQIM